MPSNRTSTCGARNQTAESQPPNDDGSPAYDHAMAASLAEVGVAAFACTPDQFPDLMAAAIERRDLGRWAAENRITTAAPLT